MNTNEKVMTFMGICSLTGIIAATIQIATTGIEPSRKEKIIDYTTFIPHCKQMIADNYKIAGSEELRTAICNDQSMYTSDGVDRTKALDTYKTIVDSIKNK